MKFETETLTNVKFLAAPGECARLIRTRGWAKTSLGSVETWPQNLCSAVSICLNSHFPMVIWWGKDLLKIYNDAFMHLIGSRHPFALGASGQDAWPDVWPVISPVLQTVLREERSVVSEDQLLILNRNGYPEECYFTFSHSPLYDNTGKVGGVFTAVTETTPHVTGKRQMQTLRELSENISDRKSLEDIYNGAAKTFDNNRADFPFTLIYSIDYKTFYAKRVALSGIAHDHPVAPLSIDLTAEKQGAENLRTVIENNQPLVVTNMASGLGVFPTGNWPVQPHQSLVIPVSRKGRQPYALMIIGVNPHQKLTGNYMGFFQLNASQVANELGNFMEKEQRLQLDTNITLLRESEQHYRQLIQGLPAAIYTCDAEGYIRMYNPAAEILWGKIPRVGVDKWCGSWKIYKNDGSSMPLEECPMAVALREGHPVRGTEIIVERLDGTRRHALPHPQPIFDSSGKISGAVNMLLDITENKQIENALRESEGRFRVVADNAPVIIWMTNESKACVFLNKCWCEFTGKSFREGLGDGWIDEVHPDDYPVTAAAFNQANRNFSVYTCELRLKKSNGEYRWVRDHAIPRFDPDGAFLGYIGTSIDIHEQKNANEELEKRVELRTQELQKANETLLKTNQQLEQFAYVSSHDLQEPLRKIQVFSDFVLSRVDKRGGDEDSIKYLHKVIASANRMSGLISDLLDFSRLNIADQQFMYVDLAQVLNNVKGDFEALLLQKFATLTSDALPVIRGVPVQLNQLFYNLVSNALKFSDKKPIITIKTCEVSPEACKRLNMPGKAADYLQISFSDNGIGFDQQYAEKIFTLFQRLNAREKYSGTGIGLALCKKIIENHNGFIEAEGKPGIGATFYIYLPKH